MTSVNPNRQLELYRLRQVTKTYGERLVLQIEDLSVFQGEILALIGPSGAGKSTLLRLLNFLEKPTTGDITFQHYHLNGKPVPLPVQREITMVFQKPILLNRTVRDNIRFGLDIRGRKQPTPQVDDLLMQVGLHGLADLPARTLSGGEAQRVALARALAIQPTVLLLDEPTANLDPTNVRLIEDIIRQINHTRHTTIILVTHNIFQARRLAHRTTLLLNGHIIETAPTETLFTQPRDPRTQAFIQGDMVY